MEKNYLKVPEKQNFLDFLSDLDSEKLSSTLFISKDLFEKLIKSCSEYQPLGRIHKLIWEADDVYCRRTLTISNSSGTKWKRITEIDIFRVDYKPDNSKGYFIS